MFRVFFFFWKPQLEVREFKKELSHIINQIQMSWVRFAAHRHIWSRCGNLYKTSFLVSDHYKDAWVLELVHLLLQGKLLRTVFPHIVYFLNLEIVPNSKSCHNISTFYLINWIFAAETIQGQKLNEERRYVETFVFIND